jgi:hypothetical protein
MGCEKSRLPAPGPEQRILWVCHWGIIIIIRAEMAIVHVIVNVTVSNVAQAASDTVFVAAIGAAMRTANIRCGNLLLFPHLSNNFKQFRFFEARMPENNLLRQNVSENAFMESTRCHGVRKFCVHPFFRTGKYSMRWHPSCQSRAGRDLCELELEGT